MVVLVLVAASGVVVLNAGAGDSCWKPSRATARLADDPARATRALDPGASGAQDDKLRSLLADSHWKSCEGEPSASRVLGGILIAATTGRPPGGAGAEAPAVRHTAGMARVLHASVSVLGDRGTTSFPPGFRPYAARLLAAWPASVNTGVSGYSEEAGAARDPHAKEYRARFDRDDHSTLALTAIVERLAADPESYALLYDALRAHVAASLDPVRRADAHFGTGGGKDGKDGKGAKAAPPVERTPHARLEGAIDTIAVLAHARDTHLAEGTIEDGAAFDAAVLRHSRGGYAASARPAAAAYAPEGEAALRTPAKPARAWAAEGAAASQPRVRGARDTAAWFMDGRQQIRRTVNLWVRDREVPAADADRLRGALDRSYQLALSLRGSSGGDPGLGY